MSSKKFTGISSKSKSDVVEVNCEWFCTAPLLVLVLHVGDDDDIEDVGEGKKECSDDDEEVNM